MTKNKPSRNYLGEEDTVGESVLFPVEDTFSTPSGLMANRTLGRSVEIAISELPEITAPSLEGLAVSVGPTEPITQELLLSRLALLQLEHATFIPRVPGELIQPGDMLVLNIMGYSQQKILPFSVNRGMQVRVEPQPELPGLFEALVGNDVGESLVVHATLPQSYPLAELRGEPAVFAVEISEVYRVCQLDLDNPDELLRLGMGESVEEVLVQLRDRVEEEMAESMLRQATRLVMEQLSERAPVEIPQKLIREEIRQLWIKQEGMFLQSSEIEAEDIEASLESWLADVGIRKEVQKRLHFAVLIRTIAEQLAPTFKDEELDEFLHGLASELEFPIDTVRASLQKEPQVFQQIIDKFVSLRTLNFIMQHAQVEFTEE